VKKIKIGVLILLVLFTFGNTGYAAEQMKPGSTSINTEYVNVEQRIYAGEECIYVIKDDGSLWSWGSNEHGMRGDGTKPEYNQFSAVPKKILDNVKTLQVNNGFAFALKKDVTLWGWGVVNWGPFGRKYGIEYKDAYRDARGYHYILSPIKILPGGEKGWKSVSRTGPGMR
jgi:alpha-tubulin suppressor-like RCC1 family protein